MQRTAIYVLSGIVLTALGVIAVLLSGDNMVGLSISTSVVASGLSSISFAIIRYFDDADSERRVKEIASSLVEVGSALNTVQSAVSAVRRNLNEGVVVREGRDRNLDKHPYEEVKAELEGVNGFIEIDVMGFTLKSFMDDWGAFLANRGEVAVRLILQNHQAPLFEAACRQEARDVQTMRADITQVLEYCRELRGGTAPIEGTSSCLPALDIKVRAYSDVPTVTLTRIDKMMLVRPRRLREGTQDRSFFERYTSDDHEGAFRSYRELFRNTWDASEVAVRD